MFKLYSMGKGIKLLDQSQDEQDIKDTLGEYMSLSDTIDYMVIESTMFGDNTKALIKNFGDYMDYVIPEKEKTLTKHL